MEKPNEDASEWEALTWKIREERNALFKAVFGRISSELAFGNDVSVVCQVETNDKDERERYNEIYGKEEILLTDLSDTSENVELEFNIEYEITDKNG